MGSTDPAGNGAPKKGDQGQPAGQNGPAKNSKGAGTTSVVITLLVATIAVIVLLRIFGG